MRRVVVTGIGMCTPLGFGYSHCWKQLISAKSGIRKLTGFEIEDLKSKVGGQLILEGDSALFPEKVIEQKDRKKINKMHDNASCNETQVRSDCCHLESESDSNLDYWYFAY